MLECAGVLRTWSLPELPAAGKILVGQGLADHRLEYLELEGPLSGNRGSVRRVEAGSYELLEESECLLRIKVSGKLLGGILELRRATGADSVWRVSIVQQTPE